MGSADDKLRTKPQAATRCISINHSRLRQLERSREDTCAKFQMLSHSESAGIGGEERMDGVEGWGEKRE